MSIYAISDLHLALSDANKTMEIFGKAWENYQEKLRQNWLNTIKNKDTVIIPGDISWGKRLEDCYDDFYFLNKLPGEKIIMKGNHDIYFSTVKKMQDFLDKNNFNTIHILHNNSFFVEGYNICGTRFWSNTDMENVDDDKILAREVERIKLSLNSIKEENKACPIIFATHFPPFRKDALDIFHKYNVKTVIYGHLHGASSYQIKEGIIDGINYIMVSGDHTGFNLVKLN